MYIVQLPLKHAQSRKIWKIHAKCERFWFDSSLQSLILFCLQIFMVLEYCMSIYLHDTIERHEATDWFSSGGLIFCFVLFVAVSAILITDISTDDDDDHQMMHQSAWISRKLWWCHIHYPLVIFMFLSFASFNSLILKFFRICLLCIWTPSKSKSNELHDPSVRNQDEITSK